MNDSTTPVAKPRIVFLDWLRMVACFMVMTVHASECIYSDDYAFSFPTAGAKWAVLLFQSFVRPTAVPLFLMASAFLLVPVRTDAVTFFRKRFARVVIPLAVFVVLYAVLPFCWGAQTGAETGMNLRHAFVNFPVAGSHLWFVYMLIGVYFIMPVISPWLAQASRREELLFLGIWLFTTVFYRLRPLLGGAIFGECWWNENAAFYYVSGFVGFVVLGHFIRVHLKWSARRILSVCIPLVIGIYLLGFASAYHYSFTTTTPAELERDWQNMTLPAVVMSFALFLLFSLIKAGGPFYEKVVLRISRASYGMYLMHMLVLPHWFALLNGHLPYGLLIPATAGATYVTTFVLSAAISKLPFGKYIVG